MFVLNTRTNLETAVLKWKSSFLPTIVNTVALFTPPILTLGCVKEARRQETGEPGVRGGAAPRRRIKRHPGSRKIWEGGFNVYIDPDREHRADTETSAALIRDQGVFLSRFSITSKLNV